MVRMATELKRVAEEWDPLMSRSLQFSNVIDGGMSVYKDLFAKKKKERQQLPITMFFSRTNTPAPRASEEENTAERSQDAAGGQPAIPTTRNADSLLICARARMHTCVSPSLTVDSLL